MDSDSGDVVTMGHMTRNIILTRAQKLLLLKLLLLFLHVFYHLWRLKVYYIGYSVPR